MPTKQHNPMTHAASGRLPRGRLLSLRTSAPYDLAFHAYLPCTTLVTDRVLICIHGINRRARDQATAFQVLAEQLGLTIIAPLFEAGRYPNYQRLGRGNDPRADLALDAAVAQVASAVGLDREPQRLLFGYSGGGQFAHRYAATHPERVAAVVIGAAGWYTLPDPQRRFPHGLGRRTGLPTIDAAAYLDIPMAVLVGHLDRDRGAGFNCMGSKDRDQGRTRVDRGRHFIGRMRCAAREQGLETTYRFELLPGVGHSFADAVDTGGLVHKVGAFLVAVGAAQPGAASKVASRPVVSGPQKRSAPDDASGLWPLTPTYTFG